MQVEFTRYLVAIKRSLVAIMIYLSRRNYELRNYVTVNYKLR